MKWVSRPHSPTSPIVPFSFNGDPHPHRREGGVSPFPSPKGQFPFSFSSRVREVDEWIPTRVDGGSVPTTPPPDLTYPVLLSPSPVEVLVDKDPSTDSWSVVPDDWGPPMDRDGRHGGRRLHHQTVTTPREHAA